MMLGSVSSLHLTFVALSLSEMHLSATEELLTRCHVRIYWRKSKLDRDMAQQ
jgi:hypothetical protein